MAISDNPTTFSIEIFSGKFCENNDYGVRPHKVIDRMNELLNMTSLGQMLSGEGIRIEIKKEQ